jgi:hypothetical protein
MSSGQGSGPALPMRQAANSQDPQAFFKATKRPLILSIVFIWNLLIHIFVQIKQCSR